RGVLLPVLADKISPPVEFRDINCVDFSAWDGSRDAPEFRSLLSAVRSRTGSAAEPAAASTSVTYGAPAPRSAGGRAVSAVTGAIGALFDLMRPSRYRREKAGDEATSPPVAGNRAPRDTTVRGPARRPEAATEEQKPAAATRSRAKSGA